MTDGQIQSLQVETAVEELVPAVATEGTVNVNDKGDDDAVGERSARRHAEGGQSSAMHVLPVPLF